MGKRMSALYKGLSNRFAGLSVAAAEEDDEDEERRKREAREQGPDEEDEEEAGISDEEKNARKGRNENRRAGKKPCGDEEDGDPEGNAAAVASSARAAERARWGAVLSSAEAIGRAPLACSLLADTDMTAEQIRSAISKSPAETPPKRQGLAERMAAVARPDVGSGGGASAAAAAAVGTPGAKAADIVSAYNKASGAAPDDR